jgi:uncharacterized protein (TIGR03435 family)
MEAAEPALAVVLACALSIAAGAAQTTAPRFDVASIKKWSAGTSGGLSRQDDHAFDRSRATVVSLMEFAFDVREFQIAGGPEWIRREAFEVHAKTGENATPARLRLMVQTLLADRFALRVRHDEREMPVFALTQVRRSPGLVPRDEAYCRNHPMPTPHVPPGAMRGGGCGTIDTMATLSLSPLLRAPVVDQTGLKGMFEWSLIHSREGLPLLAMPVDPQLVSPPADPNVPSLFDALREQLGLRLERRRAPVNVIVIDAIELPSPN